MNEKIQKWAVAISNDDEFAFKLLFDHFYPRLYGYALSLVKSHSPSEEIVSDVFVKVWRKRERLAEIENISHYLFRAVKNQTINYLDKKTLSLVDLDQVREKDVKGFLQPDISMMDRELASQIAIAIDSLPPRAKLIFGLIREDGFKYKEVADQLDLSIKTVENQMNIAIKKLKEKLTPYFKDNPTKLSSWLLTF
ncbi:RNA polymerase sigma-70 factor [Reichenbachiella sp. MALMAid0571]|uniref:RNA polymerase sigma-70 factor n=1 Tax=Reichenbachiella sp. MALMAid0571 TaxID=3143939 RepID=UPI0032DFBA5A